MDHFEIRTSRDLARITRNLDQLADGKKLKRAFARDVRREVRPVATKLRAAYRANPSKNKPNTPRGRRDLRRLLASAVQVKVKTSGQNPQVSIMVNGKRMPSGMGGVPAMYEGKRPWRHPVFKTGKWVQQDPEPTFDRVVRPAATGVRRRVQSIADDAMKDVAKG